MPFQKGHKINIGKIIFMKEELHTKIYVVDVDNTICETINGDYINAKPYKDRIDKLNKLYDEGNTIIYWTARGSETGISWDNFTRKQFKDWGVKYKFIRFDKIYGDYYVDDRGINSKEFF